MLIFSQLHIIYQDI